MIQLTPKDIKDFITKNLPTVLIVCLVVIPATWAVTDTLYKYRIEQYIVEINTLRTQLAERDTAIEQYTAEISALRTQLTERDTAIQTPGCEADNLLACSQPFEISVPDKSRSSIAFVGEGLRVDFNNEEDFSGVAFRFTPALDVRGFGFLEVNGAASQDFSFHVEYKVRANDGKLYIVTSSAGQLFPATSGIVKKVPLAYDGTIHEIVIIFFTKGEASELTINSIRLLK